MYLLIIAVLKYILDFVKFELYLYIHLLLL